MYAAFRPLSGELDSTQVVFEIVLWTCNVGYITFELFELKDKTFSGYFNVGVKGQVNCMSYIISIKTNRIYFNQFSILRFV